MVLSVRLAHLTRSTLARVHLRRATDALVISLSFVRGTNTNYFSLSLSFSHTYTYFTYLAPSLSGQPRTRSLLSRDSSRSLRSAKLVTCSRSRSSSSLSTQALSVSLSFVPPQVTSTRPSLSRTDSFTTAQWGLNHTEVGDGGGSRAVVEWRGASKAVGSEGGGTSRRLTERWKGERERESEDSGSEKEREATPLTGRCHSTESPLRSRGSLTPVAQSAWLDFRAVFHRSFRAEAPTWCST